MIEPEIIKTPKLYWRTRRVDGHSDWSFAFWRELFQNEVDAKASRIDISIKEVDGKGVFGREPRVDKVVRVKFSGNGSGMDEKIIREVFLRPGETTKKNGIYQGGFGTARIMLCFSQVRYRVRTHEWVVDGDGSEYTCQTFDQARTSLEQKIIEAEGYGKDSLAAKLREELDDLNSEPSYIRGCQFEIDIDPEEFEEKWKNVNYSKLLRDLEKYLDMSQLPCKVFVNDKEALNRTVKGPSRRKLTSFVNDEEVSFATVHVSKSERAKFTGKVIIRSSGATMFSEYTGTNEQVIVELDPAKSRECLTDNRDGMRAPYGDALNNFIQQLVVDKQSALTNAENRRHIKISGGKGHLVVKPPKINFGANDGNIIFSGNITPEPGRSLYVSKEEYQEKGYGGVPPDVVDDFLKATRDGETTIIYRIGEELNKQKEISDFVAAIKAGEGSEALRKLGHEVSGALSGTLHSRYAEAVDNEDAAERRRLAETNDIHVQVDDLGDNKALKAAVGRYMPSFWRQSGEENEGRGIQAHMLLAAWTACCHEAATTLLALHPNVAKEGHLKIGTGFYFGKPEMEWDRFTQSSQPRRIGAQHQERDGLHVLLVNPVRDDGTQIFDLSKKRRNLDEGHDAKLGWQDLEVLALHEVCHIVEQRHDEDFSTLMTEVAAIFDRDKAYARIQDVLNAVMGAYGRGKTIVQTMDAPPAQPRRRGRPPKVRPAEVLLAHAIPTTSLVVGAMNAEENTGVDIDAMNMLVVSAISETEDAVVTEIDCDRLQHVEQDLLELSKADWKIDVAELDLPAIDEILQLDATPKNTEIKNEETERLGHEPHQKEQLSQPEINLQMSESVDILDVASLDLPDMADIPALMDDKNNTERKDSQLTKAPHLMTGEDNDKEIVNHDPATDRLPPRQDKHELVAEHLEPAESAPVLIKEPQGIKGGNAEGVVTHQNQETFSALSLLGGQLAKLGPVTPTPDNHDQPAKPKTEDQTSTNEDILSALSGLGRQLANLDTGTNENSEQNKKREENIRATQKEDPNKLKPANYLIEDDFDMDDFDSPRPGHI